MKNLCLIIIIALTLTEVIFSQRGEVSRVPHRGEERTINSDREEPSDSRLDRAKDNKDKKTEPVVPVQVEPSPSELIDPGYSINPAVYCQVTVDIIDIPAREVKVYTSKKKEGIESLDNKNYSQAVLLFSDAIAENQKDIELYYLRGLAELGYGSYDRAIEDFTYYLKFFDDDGEAYFRRGLAIIYSGEKEEAKRDFLLAVEYGFTRGNEILNKYY